MTFTYFGHIMRKKDKCLEKKIIQGTTPGARAKSRPKTSWLGNIRLWTGLTMEELLRTDNAGRLLFMTQSTLESRMLKKRTSVYTEPRNKLLQVLMGSRGSVRADDGHQVRSTYFRASVEKSAGKWKDSENDV